MTKEKALIMALKIVDNCKTYGNEDRCLQCPFNINDCIVSDGNAIPTDWRVGGLMRSIDTKSRKE